MGSDGAAATVFGLTGRLLGGRESFNGNAELVPRREAGALKPGFDRIRPFNTHGQDSVLSVQCSTLNANVSTHSPVNLVVRQRPASYRATVTCLPLIFTPSTRVLLLVEHTASSWIRLLFQSGPLPGTRPALGRSSLTLRHIDIQPRAANRSPNCQRMVPPLPESHCPINGPRVEVDI